MKFLDSIRKIDFRRCRSFIIAGIMVLLVLVLAGVHNGFTGQLDTQSLAERWSSDEDYAQISCFFPEGTGMTEREILSMEQAMMNALTEATIDTEDGNGRKLVDAYSTEGMLTLSSDRAFAEARAYGVSKDFFLFHPLELLSGSYFAQSDTMEDGVILDETVAWKLFGSYNVTGMTVEIGNRSYVVRGVVRSDKGAFSEAADEEAATVYVDYAVLEYQMDQELTADSYEVLIANPVSDFGTTTVKNVIGRDENSYEMVENSSRFGVMSRLNRLRNFGARSMSTKGIIYPYWENRARGYEDVSTLILVIQIILLIYPVFLLCKGIRHLWKNKAAIWKKIRDFFGLMIKKLYKDRNTSGKTRNFPVKWKHKTREK